jgi:hypothetical protein
MPAWTGEARAAKASAHVHFQALFIGDDASSSALKSSTAANLWRSTYSRVTA